MYDCIESIGKYTMEKSEKSERKSAIQKRGLINIIGAAMKTLFEVCDNVCAEDTTN